MLLKGKKCVITGSSQGVGKAIALTYAKEGAQLILVARNTVKLDQVKADCLKLGSPQVDVLPCDLSSLDATEALAKKILETYKFVDVLVNNAGYIGMGSVLDGDPADWQRMMNINVVSVMCLTRRLATPMIERENGVIINICSVAGVEGMKQVGGYAASKFALRGWSLSCYEALREKNIKVVCLNPGMINNNEKEGHPYDKMITSSDIAECALLPMRTSAGCCPQDLTLRLTRRAF